ncbi:NHLP leader peptide family RiPP precursor [Niveispirillum sp. KHB5.9]|uniref:NHLP leader peptide family RiPP precursor n=1 Tax=Niveispirillum sp. KHB5.9 TaxID=3400269 RepID=UPI003A85DC22
MMNEANDKAASKIIAKAWADDGFKARLLADPAAVLKAEGLEIPAGIAVRVVEETSTTRTLVLPARPTDLSDDELDSVDGGGVACWCRPLSAL